MLHARPTERLSGAHTICCAWPRERAMVPAPGMRVAELICPPIACRSAGAHVGRRRTVPEPQTRRPPKRPLWPTTTPVSDVARVCLTRVLDPPDRPVFVAGVQPPPCGSGRPPSLSQQRRQQRDRLAAPRITPTAAVVRDCPAQTIERKHLHTLGPRVSRPPRSAAMRALPSTASLLSQAGRCHS